jgi:Caspase domain
VDGKRKALIVANDDYEHEGLNRLRGPAADAAALAGVLGDEQIGDFEVQVVHNEPAHVIQLEIEDFLLQGRSDDVLLLHFSCHGLKSESGELFFAARNTRPNRLGATAVSADFVQRCIRASRSGSIVLLLDCCYGGAFGEGVSVRAAGDVNVLDSFPPEKAHTGRGRAVITASGAMQYAFDGNRLASDQSPRPSLFTSALVDGLLTGDADRDEDGWVSLSELYDYVFDRVSEQTPDQTPGRDIKMEGEFYLARSRRRHIQPLPTPPLLAAAISDPNSFTRLGAVAELRLRLLGDNLPAAAGAGDALAEIARTDIQYVADAAAAALAEAAIRTGEPELHFGTVLQDSPAVHRTVHLLGPPIARACMFHASHGWLHVEETSEGLDVRVDTALTGARRGNIVLKGRPGELVIPVDIDVITEPQPEPEPAGTETPGVASPPHAEPDDRTPSAEPEVGAPSPGPREPASSPPPPGVPPHGPTGPASPKSGGASSRRRIPAIVLSGVILAAVAGLAGRAVLSHDPGPAPSPTATGVPTTPPSPPATPSADPQFFFSGLVTSEDPLPPRLTGNECVVTTKVEMRGSVNFALTPGYHLRPEDDGPYTCNMSSGTPDGLWTTCEAYDDVTGKKSRLSPGHYELVATGTDAAGVLHTAGVDVNIVGC